MRRIHRPAVLRARSNAGPALLPSQIAGLKLWLDAQTGLTKSNAAQFLTASSKYLSHTSNTDLQLGDISFTYAGWVRFDSYAAAQTLIAKDSNTVNREIQISYDTASTNVYAQVFTAGNTGKTAAIARPSAGAWTFVAVYHDATTDVLSIELNRGAAGTIATGTLQAASTAEFRLGSNAYSGGIFFLGGAMQNWGFWKRKLTTTELDSLYNSGAGKNYSALTSGEKASLVSWWALDELAGARADSHGANPLTDNNSVAATAGPVLSGAAPGNGDYIGKWADQSGLATDFTTGLGGASYSTGVAGIAGKNEVVFSGADTMLSAAVSSRKPFTYAYVARAGGTSGSNRVLIGSFNTSGTAVLIGGGNVQQATVASTGVGAGVNAWAAGTYHVGLVTYDGSGNYAYYFDGVLEASGTNNQTPSVGQTMVLGAHSAALANPFTGGKVESAFFDNVISTSDRQGLIRYLGNKHGLPVSP